VRTDTEDAEVSLGQVLTFHQNWFWVAVISCGVVAAWGLAMELLNQSPPRAFSIARSIAIGVMLIQVGAGVYLYASGVRPGNSFHVFYGVVIAITFALAYVYRSTMARRPALTYGVLLLFVMGLGLRAWSQIA
jgi:predicted membrane channel-forming protein YqfA (hemolysin III family)